MIQKPELPKSRNAMGRIDAESYNELVRFGRVTRLGHCRLVSIGVYLVLTTLRSVEDEIMDNSGKTLDEFYNLFNKWPQKYAFKPFENIISERFIPDHLRDEIMSIIIKESRKGSSSKQVKGGSP